MNKKRGRYIKRKRRVRAKVFGTTERPRLSVFRSNKHIYSQIIDDGKGETLVAISDKGLARTKTKNLKKTQVAALVGEELAKAAKAKKISRIVFDRGGYRYHGRVKALAEAARKAGMKF
jgi:large subunit ribosomal protein L18